MRVVAHDDDPCLGRDAPDFVQVLLGDADACPEPRQQKGDVELTGIQHIFKGPNRGFADPQVRQSLAIMCIDADPQLIQVGDVAILIDGMAGDVGDGVASRAKRLKNLPVALFTS